MKAERTEAQGVEVTGETKARVMPSALKIVLGSPTSRLGVPTRPRIPVPDSDADSATVDKPIHAGGSRRARPAAQQDASVGEAAGNGTEGRKAAAVREKGNEEAGSLGEGSETEARNGDGQAQEPSPKDQEPVADRPRNMKVARVYETFEEDEEATRQLRELENYLLTPKDERGEKPAAFENEKFLETTFGEVNLFIYFRRGLEEEKDGKFMQKTVVNGGTASQQGDRQQAEAVNAEPAAQSEDEDTTKTVSPALILDKRDEEIEEVVVAQVSEVVDVPPAGSEDASLSAPEQTIYEFKHKGERGELPVKKRARKRERIAVPVLKKVEIEEGVEQKRYSGTMRPPQYLDEVEAILGLPLFEKEAKEDTLRESDIGFNQAELGARELIYTQSLRILAQARLEDRKRNKERLGERFNGQEFNNAWNQHVLTTKGLANIVESYKVEVRPIARQLTMRHNIERFFEDEEGRSSLRPNQHPYLESIFEFLQKGAVPIQLLDEEGNDVLHFSQGATVIAPSGLGKTVLMAHTVKGLGVGETSVGAKTGEKPLRALVVVPSQDLVEQFTGKVGDDTFRRFAPGVSVGAYYQKERNDQADVVVITQEKFVEDFKDGKLNDEEFDIAMFDEGHHLTAPKFLQTFRQHWKGPVIGFTATPDYSPTKDVRAVLPYEIYHGSTIDYINDGALNAGQLFMFRVDPKEHADALPSSYNLEDPLQLQAATEHLVDKSVVDFVLPLLKEGRRGMIFCESGNESEQARYLARLLSTAREKDGSPIILPDGKRINAQAIGTFRTISKHGSRSDEVRRQYNEGNVHVITSTEMSREGFNADIDFVIMAAPTISKLKMMQIIGRGTRLSSRFPTTVYAQFFTPRVQDNIPIQTLFELFGMNKVVQGVRIGPRSTLANNSLTTKLRKLPRYLKDMSEGLHLRSIKEAITANFVPSNYIQLDTAREGTNLLEYHARRLLRHEGFNVIRKAEVLDGKRSYVTYIEPAGAAYLQENKRPAQATNGEISVTRLAKELKVSTEFLQGRVRLLAEEGNIALLDRTNHGPEGDFLDSANRAIVEEYVRTIPVADPGDAIADRFARMLGYSSKEDLAAGEEIEISYKQYVGDKGRSFHYTVNASDAERLLLAKYGDAVFTGIRTKRAADLANRLQSVPLAAPTDMTKADILRKAGLNPRQQDPINAILTEADLELGVIKAVTSEDGIHTTSGQFTVWTQEAGDALVERLRARRVTIPPHLIAMPGILNVVDVTFVTAKNFMKGNGYIDERLNLPGGGLPPACYTWEALRTTLRRYGRLPGSKVRINFDMLPVDENDTNPEKVAYARGIQYILMPENRLGFNEEQLAEAKEMARRIRRPNGRPLPGTATQRVAAAPAANVPAEQPARVVITDEEMQEVTSEAQLIHLYLSKAAALNILPTEIAGEVRRRLQAGELSNETMQIILTGPQEMTADWQVLRQEVSTWMDEHKSSDAEPAQSDDGHHRERRRRRLHQGLEEPQAAEPVGQEAEASAQTEEQSNLQQRDPIDIALEEKEQSTDFRKLQGPHLTAFEAIDAQSVLELREIDDSLTIEYIAPSIYQSQAVSERIAGFDRQKAARVQNVKYARQTAIDNLVRSELSRAMRQQKIDSSLLDEPPEENLAEFIGGPVRAMRLDGANLEMIAQFANGHKNKNPQGKRYVLTPIRTSEENEDQDIYHWVAVLGADEKYVTVMELNERIDNREPLSMPKGTFINRWATTSNRVYLLSTT